MHAKSATYVTSLGQNRLTLHCAVACYDFSAHMETERGMARGGAKFWLAPVKLAAVAKSIVVR